MKSVKNQRGATLVEYSLLVALIAVACISSVRMVGESVRCTFRDAESGLRGAYRGRGPVDVDSVDACSK